jgi:hypothetical protein
MDDEEKEHDRTFLIEAKTEEKITNLRRRVGMRMLAALNCFNKCCTSLHYECTEMVYYICIN